MHNEDTRNEFRRLRIRGFSLSSIGRQLGVSKPTIIKWNREFKTELGAVTGDGFSPLLRARDSLPQQNQSPELAGEAAPLPNSQNLQLPNSSPTHGTHDHSCSLTALPVAPPLGELAELRRKQNVLRQELVSRALKDVSTAILEKLAGDLRKRIEDLESLLTQTKNP